MKGTDVSPEELDHAREFLEYVSRVAWPADSDGDNCILSRAELIRVVAWYGAIRASGPPRPWNFMPSASESSSA